MLKRWLFYLVITSVLFFSACLITGKVVDENGVGVSGVTVTLSGDDSRVVVTDSEGKYRFGDIFNQETWVTEGNYTVTPSRPGDRFTPASSPVEITKGILGDDEVPLPAPGVNFVEVAETFTYDVSFDKGDPNPLTARITLDDQPLAIPVTGLATEGTYNTVTQATTLNPNSVISADTTQDLFGELELSVTQLVKWTGNDNPAEGAFEINSEVGIIQVSINPDVGGSPGLDITFGNNSTSFTWSDFEELEENPAASEDQQIAAFSFAIFEFAFEHIFYTFQALQPIKDNETTLEAAGSQNVGFVETCDQFPPQSGSSGAREYMWIDASANGLLGSGDNFVVTYDSDINGCWYDDPKDNIDILVKGTLKLNNYVRTLDGKQNLIGVGADVLFENFVERETEEVSGNNIIVDDYALRTDGGFNVVIAISNLTY